MTRTFGPVCLVWCDTLYSGICEAADVWWRHIHPRHDGEASTIMSQTPLEKRREAGTQLRNPASWGPTWRWLCPRGSASGSSCVRDRTWSGTECLLLPGSRGHLRACDNTSWDYRQRLLAQGVLCPGMDWLCRGSLLLSTFIVLRRGTDTRSRLFYRP